MLWRQELGRHKLCIQKDVEICRAFAEQPLQHVLLLLHQGLTSTEMPRALGPIVTVPTFTRKSQYW